MKISYDWKRVTFKTEPKELFEAEKSGTKPNTIRILGIDEYDQLRRCNPKKIIIQYQQEIFLRTITNIHATKGVFGKVIVVISWTNEAHHHTMSRESSSHGYGDHTQGLDDNLEIPIEPPTHIRSGGKVTGDVTFAMTEGENAPAVSPHSVPVEPGPHNASAEQRPDTPTMPSIYKCVNCTRGMQEEEEPGSTPESPTKLDDLTPILLPRTLIHNLGRFRQDKSHADFIRELMLANLKKQEIKPDYHVHAVRSDDDEGFVDICISKQMFKTLQNSFSGRTMNSVVQELHETYLFKLAEERKPPIDLSQTVMSIPKTLVTDLNFYRRMTTIPEFIFELLELYRTKQAEERGPLHD